MINEEAAHPPVGVEMSKSSNLGKLITIAAALAGLGAVAVYVVRMLREKQETDENAVDDLLNFYSDKAAELDKIVGDSDFRIAN